MENLRLAELDRGFEGTALEHATITIYESLAAAESAWRRAIDHCACFLFQTFEWTATWSDTAGRLEDASERIVHIADADGRTLLLVPLAIVKRRRLRVLAFLGGTFADYNAPLIDRNLAAALDAPNVRRLWRTVLGLLPKVDAVWLARMPKSIDGIPNPLAELPRVRHTDDAYAATLPATFKEFAAVRSSQFFAQIRRHRRRLEQRGCVEISFPVEHDQRIEVVRALAQQKSDWLRTHGFDNAFDRPSTREFYERLTNCPLQSGNILVACLRVGDQIAATLWGAIFGPRYYFLVPTYAEKWRKFSAGRILTQSVLQRCIAQGDIRVFDLTLGEESYKQTWCDHSLALHEHLEAHSAKGLAFVAWRRLRQLVRRHPRLRAFARAGLVRLRMLAHGSTFRKQAEA